MQPSLFNARVPLPERGEVFLMNTFTDAQLIVSSDVAELLDRLAESPGQPVAFTLRSVGSGRPGRAWLRGARRARA